MTAVEESTDNALWDASISSKSSWADAVEEEKGLINTSSKKTNGLTVIKNRTSPNFKFPVVKEDSAFDDDANIGTTKGLSNIPSVDSLPNFGKSVDLETEKTPVKKAPEIPQDDISLTSHLDVKLGLISPAKTEEVPSSSGRRVYLMKSTVPRTPPSKLNKRKAPENSGVLKVEQEDQLLMPSPSKILKTTPKKESQTGMSPAAHEMITRKRVRDALTPTPQKSASRKQKRDVETDPEVLARRQRQIDYGKNTLGYERYRQLVPREQRKSMHPKTPPLGIKFSRRAWDGLIRVWRQRLHFWDPPSEGGGNPECLEIPSDMSDCSSIDGSLPNTPVQEMKRKRSGERAFRYSTSRLSYGQTKDDPVPDDDGGCAPLSDE